MFSSPLVIQISKGFFLVIYPIIVAASIALWFLVIVFCIFSSFSISSSVISFNSSNSLLNCLISFSLISTLFKISITCFCFSTFSASLSSSLRFSNFLFNFSNSSFFWSSNIFLTGHFLFISFKCSICFLKFFICGSIVALLNISSSISCSFCISSFSFIFISSSCFIFIVTFSNSLSTSSTLLISCFISIIS
ncbi:hypothetical protein L21TH_2025 [Caldisalinibacter kiritimatiensis]|uniref:Uncharacterized protein n=1 Tax=Caldisalinibacter kiritimatiensis TaxID=1304284 RepID=R1CC87_9FIRM|nr:hypothetical protein L21TH_2025 [Caldisalinibacter kiritimatiensis]